MGKGQRGRKTAEGLGEQTLPRPLMCPSYVMSQLEGILATYLVQHPILQMKTVKQREGKWFAPGHTAISGPVRREGSPVPSLTDCLFAC